MQIRLVRASSELGPIRLPQSFRKQYYNGCSTKIIQMDYQKRYLGRPRKPRKLQLCPKGSKLATLFNSLRQTDMCNFKCFELLPRWFPLKGLLANDNFLYCTKGLWTVKKHVILLKVLSKGTTSLRPQRPQRGPPKPCLILQDLLRAVNRQPGLPRGRLVETSRQKHSLQHQYRTGNPTARFNIMNDNCTRHH